MCSEQIADEHQHVVNVEGRQLMCVCRGCYLLFTDAHATLRFRAVPDRYLSFPEFALGPPGLGAPADSGGAGVLLPQLVAGPHGRVLSRAGGGHRIRAGSGRLERYSGGRPAGGHARRRHRSAAGAGARRRTATARMPSGADRRLLRVRRPAADALARLRRRPAGARVRRRVLRSLLGDPASKVGRRASDAR